MTILGLHLTDETIYISNNINHEQLDLHQDCKFNKTEYGSVFIKNKNNNIEVYPSNIKIIFYESE